MKWLLFLLLSSTTLSLFSQSEISGRVTSNENEAIEFAVITLRQASDSAVVAYATTGTGGNWRLTTDQSGSFFIQVAMLGYSSVFKFINLSADEYLSGINLVMTPEVISLQEVVVAGRQTGVLVNGDTIRYNPDVFKDGSETVLGDLLNKLPGIEVDEKGNVTAQGKQVDKLLLNGRDFFEGNTQIATKNLPADIAESVEVLNNYSEYSLLSGFQSHEQTAINIGVNKSKMGKVTGNVSGGGGIENRYELRGSLMQLNSTFMTSLITATNNTGNETFSIEDYIRLQGGVNEFAGNQEQSATTLSEVEQKLLIHQNNVYERHSGLAGVNFSYQPENTLKLNSYLLYSENRELAEEWNRYTYLLPEQKGYETFSNLDINNRNRLFSGFLKINYQPSPLWNMVYRGQFSAMGMSENSDAGNRLMEQQVHAVGRAGTTPIGTKQNVAVMKLFHQYLFIAEASFSYNNRPFSYEMQSDSLLLPLPFVLYSELYGARQDIRQENATANIGFQMYFKLNNSYFVRTGLSASMTNDGYYSEIYRMDSGQEAGLLPGENLKNDHSLQMNDYAANFNLTKNKGFFRFKAGASAHVYDFASAGIHALNRRKALKLNPEMKISLHFSDAHTLNLSANESDHLLPSEAFLSGMVFSNYQSYRHNSRIENWYSTRRSLNLSYQLFNMYYSTMLFLVSGYSHSRNSTTVNHISSGLLTESCPIQSAPTENLYLRIHASKGLGAIPCTLKLNGGYSENSFYNQSAGKGNRIKVRNTSGSLQAVTNYRRIFNVECKAELELIDNASSFGSVKTQTIQRYAGKLKFNFSKRFRTDVEMEHFINQSLNINLYQWCLNALISYRLNDRLEINLSGQNMLHLKNQEWTSVLYNGICIAEKNFRQIPGNLLLKLKYIF
ncbi:MAG: carboxypeptidase-like regulatory domain-containing protein [Cytophagaceae bacterium]|jgi:hypothetical protein|nr:carboxypeptidase-like regulatory domain-containing protein [Cytophagaceae bacterium]